MAREVRTLRRMALAVLLLTLAVWLLALGADAVALVLGAARRTEESESAASGVAFLVADLLFAVVGWLIASRLPRSAIGWLIGAVGFLLTWLDFAYSAMAVVPEGKDGRVPAIAVAIGLSSCLWVPAVGLMAIFVVLLFPDGRLPSRRWTWLAWTSGGVLTLLTLALLLDPGALDQTPLRGAANPIGIDTPPPVATLEAVLFALFPLCMIASAWAAVRRFRTASGTERLQLKWLVAAGAFFAGFFGLMLLAGLAPAVRDNATLGSAVQVALPLALCAMPLAIGFAVLKHRLYEIDVVINKTVVFGTLAFFISAVYVAIVVGVGRAVGGGDRPNLALSIAATAVVAVAFEPVRDRVQRLANKLVYGERATPYEVLSEFADRMGGSYDAAELAPMMARIVGQGVGARCAAVWLNTGTALRREATWPSEPEGGLESPAVAGPDLLGGDRVVPVRHQGELLGAITVIKPPGEVVTPAEETLLRDVSAQAGLVLRNLRLIEDLRSSRQRLVNSQDEERRRLERNLHDGAQQSIVAVTLMIRMVRARLDPESEAAGQELDQAVEQLSTAIEELRAVARGIHPAILTERGLGPAIRSLAERSPVPVVFHDELEERAPAELERTLYYVVAEALANVIKHAHASAVEIDLSRSDTELLLEVRDDGVGGCDRSKGTGILGLLDRVSVADGTLLIASPRGGGTRLHCALPLPGSLRRAAGPPAEQPTAEPLGAGQ